MLTAKYQLIYFTSYLCSGFMIGLMFDIYRVFRGFKKRGKAFAALMDLLFWVFASIAVFAFFLFVNNGDLRYYIFIGIFLGLYLYMKFISRRIFSGIRYLVYYIFKVFRILLNILKLPFLIIFCGFKGLLNLFNKTGERVKSKVKKYSAEKVKNNLKKPPVKKVKNKNLKKSSSKKVNKKNYASKEKNKEEK